MNSRTTINADVTSAWFTCYLRPVARLVRLPSANGRRRAHMTRTAASLRRPAERDRGAAAGRSGVSGAERRPVSDNTHRKPWTEVIGDRPNTHLELRVCVCVCVCVYPSAPAERTSGRWVIDWFPVTCALAVNGAQRTVGVSERGGVLRCYRVAVARRCFHPVPCDVF